MTDKIIPPEPRSNNKYRGIDLPGREHIILGQGEYSAKHIKAAIEKRSRFGAPPIDILAVVTHPSDLLDKGYFHRDIIHLEALIKNKTFTNLPPETQSCIKHFLEEQRQHLASLKEGVTPGVRQKLASYIPQPPERRSSLEPLLLSVDEITDLDDVDEVNGVAAPAGFMDITGHTKLELKILQASVPEIKRIIGWRSPTVLTMLAIHAPRLGVEDIGFLKREIRELEEFLETPTVKALPKLVVGNIQDFLAQRRGNLMELTESPSSPITNRLDLPLSKGGVHPDTGVRSVVGRVFGFLKRS